MYVEWKQNSMNCFYFRTVHTYWTVLTSTFSSVHADPTFKRTVISPATIHILASIPQSLNIHRLKYNIFLCLWKKAFIEIFTIFSIWCDRSSTAVSISSSLSFLPCDRPSQCCASLSVNCVSEIVKHMMRRVFSRCTLIEGLENDFCWCSLSEFPYHFFSSVCLVCAPAEFYTVLLLIKRL